MPRGSVTGKPRLRWMDTLRGSAIVMLIFWHAPAIPALRGMPMPTWLRDVNAALLPFRMPTLMFLSGLLLSTSLAKPVPAYYAGKLRLLAWPYVLWGGLHILAYPGYGWPIYSPRAWLPAGYLWYLWFLLTYYLVAPMLRRLPAWVPVAAAVPPALLIDHGNSREMAYFAVFFFGGHAVRPHLESLIASLDRHPLRYGVPLGAGAVTVAVLSATVSVQYDIRYVVLVACGIALFTWLARRATERWDTRAVEFVGRESIVYYVAHFPIILAVTELFRLVHVDENLVVAPIAFVAALALCTALARTRRTTPVGWLFELPRRARAGTATPAPQPR